MELGFDSGNGRSDVLGSRCTGLGWSWIIPLDQPCAPWVRLGATNLWESSSWNGTGVPWPLLVQRGALSIPYSEGLAPLRLPGAARLFSSPWCSETALVSEVLV